MTRRAPLTPARVPATFDLIAEHYDTQVDANPGYHSNLRRAARALLDRVGHADAGFLDLGCGSGASTRALALELHRRKRPIRVLGADASVGMVDVAARKRWPRGVDFVVADAHHLDGEAQARGPYDGVLAAYLLRNVPDPDRTLRRVHALLRPGGVLVVHDYSVRGNPVAATVWTLVCWLVVVPLGWVTARHTRLYRYLWRSAFAFDTMPGLLARLERCGFTDVRVLPGAGWQRGILHTVVATRGEQG